MSEQLETMLVEARSCKRCAAQLPLGPRPVLRATATARLLIVGQAPGRRVHETGIPWNDPSGDRLREWMRLNREQFYDEQSIAIVPAGLCYPGTGPGGDLPPRPECAPHWHPRLVPLMPHLQIILLVGGYAQAYYLGDSRRKTLTETVRAWREYLPHFLPLPHPSPRNQMWLRRNPWFFEEVLPFLRYVVRDTVLHE
ncbi:MAG: uracil-DNA glycosylase family protein [Burkholderiales bacterium]|nr:uracil-DNA glycosylase family protein [Burkholderiales bacterium]